MKICPISGSWLRRSLTSSTGINTGSRTRTAWTGISHKLPSLPRSRLGWTIVWTLEAPPTWRNSVQYCPRNLGAHPFLKTRKELLVHIYVLSRQQIGLWVKTYALKRVQNRNGILGGNVLIIALACDYGHDLTQIFIHSGVDFQLRANNCAVATVDELHFSYLPGYRMLVARHQEALTTIGFADCLQR